MKRCSGLILLLVLLLSSRSALTAANTAQKHTDITCSAQSPLDGSLWLGTNGEGLLRMGRNGRQIIYNKANGQLKCDVIKALSFERESNILIILDGNGSLWTYSSTSGFKEKEGFTSPILCLQSSNNSSKHYAATADKLYYFTTSSTPEMCLELPNQAQKIVTGEEGSLWIITEQGALYIDENLNISQPNGVFLLNVTESKPFVFETPSSREVSENKASFPWQIIVLAILACALLAFFFHRFIKSRRNSTPPVQMEEEEEKEEPVATPTKSEPATEETIQSYQEIREKLEASPFGATVLSVIDSHLEDPNFGVEQISENLGFSRIHLNRKLKAETDFSPSTVLKAVRMNQAVQLLMDGNHTIAEVAACCGFSTASYFSTAFKEYFGTSPSDYMGSR